MVKFAVACGLSLLVAATQLGSNHAFTTRTTAANTITKSRGNLFLATPRTTRLSSSSSLSSAATALPEGMTKVVAKEGEGDLIANGKLATVTYSCYVADSPAPFAQGNEEEVLVGDGRMIEGWDLALNSMKLGEKSVVKISNPKYGYGAEGFPPYIPPNAELEINLEVSRISELDPFGIDLNLDDDVAQTPEDIQKAYEKMMAAKALVPKKEGLEGLIEKWDSFYFFGLFEGETGEEAPWFLKPSITFPLAFAIVGGAFAALYYGGGITERGAQVTDELDQIVISAASTFVVAMSSF